MNQTPIPYFTEEHSLFYLWKPEPQANQIQLAGEFKSYDELQKRCMTVYGVEAQRREAK
ncbi:MAG TPA: hypothetical protein VF696_02285 [Candidatus Paceibacterota bacterium]